MSTTKRDEEIERQVDKYIEELHMSLLRGYEIGVYHPSDLTGFGYGLSEWCPRFVWAKYMTKGTVYSREKAGIFERGRTYELKLGASILPVLGWEIMDSQREITHTVNLGDRDIKFISHVDFIARKPPDSQEYVIEIKSTNFHDRYNFHTYCIEPEYPKAPHVLQANFYAYQEQKPYKLVYISIGDMSCRGWEGQPDQQLFNTLVERGKVLDSYLMKQELPPGNVNWMCEFGSKKNPKSYCEFFNWCRMQGNYSPHPNMHLWCLKCKKVIKEHEDDGTGNFRVNDDGKLMCKDCGGKVVRKFGQPIIPSGPRIETGAPAYLRGKT